MSIQNITVTKSYLKIHSYLKNIKVYATTYKNLAIMKNRNNDVIVVVSMVIFHKSVDKY